MCIVSGADLAGYACAREPLTFLTNFTGEGSSGEVRVWLMASDQLADSCDVDIVPPSQSGVVLFFVDAYLRPPPLLNVTCEDSLTVVQRSGGSDDNDTLLELIMGTCVSAQAAGKVFSSHSETEHSQLPGGGLVRVKLTIGTRDEKSVVGYYLKYTIYQTGM